MSAFTGPLTITEHHVDTDTWSLVTPLIWEVGHLGSGVFIAVPADFVTDGASIPWPVRIVFPRWGRKYRRPAILHDWLIALLRHGAPDPSARNRTAADHIFRKAMKACGVSSPVRWLFYLGVRLATLAGRL
jgi:hypothetical protein